jgi:hypothetical protein
VTKTGKAFIAVVLAAVLALFIAVMMVMPQAFRDAGSGPCGPNGNSCSPTAAP